MMLIAHHATEEVQLTIELNEAFAFPIPHPKFHQPLIKIQRMTEGTRYLLCSIASSLQWASVNDINLRQVVMKVAT